VSWEWETMALQVGLIADLFTYGDGPRGGAYA